MIELIDNAYRDDARKQLYLDLAKRSQPGVIFYGLVWLVFVLPSLDYFSDAGQINLLYTLTAFIIGSSIMRMALTMIFRHYCAQKEQCGDLLLSIGVILTSLVWGMSVAYLILLNTFSEAILPLFVCTAGICAGGAAALAPSRKLVAIQLSCTLVPGVTALVLVDFPFAHSLAGLGVLFVIAMFSISNIQRREYFLALSSHYKLQEQAAKLQELSNQDSLTGLRNRRFFEDRLNDEFRRAIREGRTLSLILIDLDHFKDINDDYGHPIGDECLKEMSRALTSRFNRSMDTLARVGGEEFAALLPNTYHEDSLILANALRKEISRITIKVAGHTIQMTASLGVATMTPSPENSAHELYRQADEALYRAKDSGRNRVACAPIIELPMKKTKVVQLS